MDPAWSTQNYRIYGDFLSLLCCGQSPSFLPGKCLEDAAYYKQTDRELGLSDFLEGQVIGTSGKERITVTLTGCCTSGVHGRPLPLYAAPALLSR
eukprot:g1323.t1